MGRFRGKGHVAKEGEAGQSGQVGGSCPSTPMDSENLSILPQDLPDSPFPPREHLGPVGPLRPGSPSFRHQLPSRAHLPCHPGQPRAAQRLCFPA